MSLLNLDRKKRALEIHQRAVDKYNSTYEKLQNSGIGGYIFPVWQALFCMRLKKKFGNAVVPERIIQEIETLPFYQPQEIEFQFLPKYISRKSFYKRGEKDQYASFVDSWDVDWWLTSQNFK